MEVGPKKDPERFADGECGGTSDSGTDMLGIAMCLYTYRS
jgi:hypothetical protein